MNKMDLHLQQRVMVPIKEKILNGGFISIGIKVDLIKNNLFPSFYLIERWIRNLLFFF